MIPKNREMTGGVLSDPYLSVIISFLLKNIWIALLWRHFLLVKRGLRIIDVRSCRFGPFMCIIWEALRASMRIARGFPHYNFLVRKARAILLNEMKEGKN